MKHIKVESKGLAKQDYSAGALKLETFKLKDKLDHEKERGKNIISKREQIAFEQALIVEAQAYVVEASKRLNQESGERKTTRSSLA